MKTFQINYSVGDNFSDIYYMYYDGIEDDGLIYDSAISEIKKHLKGTVSGKINIKQIVEYKEPSR